MERVPGVATNDESLVGPFNPDSNRLNGGSRAPGNGWGGARVPPALGSHRTDRRAAGVKFARRIAERSLTAVVLGLSILFIYQIYFNTIPRHAEAAQYTILGLLVWISEGVLMAYLSYCFLFYYAMCILSDSGIEDIPQGGPSSLYPPNTIPEDTSRSTETWCNKCKISLICWQWTCFSLLPLDKKAKTQDLLDPTIVPYATSKAPAARPRRASA